MSGVTRTIERAIVRSKSTKEGFQDAWRKYREEKYAVKDEEGNIIGHNIPRNTQRQKQNHFDNKEQYFNMFAWLDQMARKADTEET